LGKKKECCSDRGLYANDPANGYLWAYDIENPGVGWGASAEDAWNPLAARDFMQGGFVWTGFDYKGEPTPYGWPDINSHFGVIDIAGFPKDIFHYYKSWWPENNADYLYLFPHWNFQSGATVDVWAFSNAEQVELFLNGKSQGKLTMPALGHVNWKIGFAAGNISAIAYRNNVQVGTQTRKTANSPAFIVLTERIVGTSGMFADGKDVALIEVRITDDQGWVVPTANNKITFSLSGPASIYGVGNGDPACHEPDKANSRSVWNGFGLVIIQSTQQAGSVTVTASSPGLPSASIQIASVSP